MNYLNFATNPMREPAPSFEELRRSFNPTKDEAYEMQRRREVNAQKIQAAIARLKAQGKW